MSDPKPPFPLPDLPRITPPSDLALLACRVLEFRDMEALTRLPDMLRDMGRDADARLIQDIVGRFATRGALIGPWAVCREKMLEVLVFDIFDWASTLRVLGERFATNGSRRDAPATSRRGTITVGNVDMPFFDYESINPVDIAIGAFTTTEDTLHATESHPDYEYARTVTSTDHAVMIRGGWDQNVPSTHRHEVPGDSLMCWMRRKAGAA